MERRGGPAKNMQETAKRCTNYDVAGRPDAKKERVFCLVSVCAALVMTAIVYAPMFKGKIPFPADFIFDFPPFAPLAPSEGLLPHTNIGDLVTSFYPYRTIAARSVRAGELPLWNPYMLSGAPFLAMAQSALFYPANLLY